MRPYRIFGQLSALRGEDSSAPAFSHGGAHGYHHWLTCHLSAQPHADRQPLTTLSTLCLALIFSLFHSQLESSSFKVLFSVYNLPTMHHTIVAAILTPDKAEVFFMLAFVAIILHHFAFSGAV